jgi:hypothetical protein
MSKNQIALFEDELAALAKLDVSNVAATGGTPFISTKGGVLTFKENAIGNSLDVVIIASPVERMYYTSRYDPTKAVRPACSALGKTMTGLSPNPAAEEPQSTDCTNCPKNQWGSAGNGSKGKACSEKRRLFLVAADQIGSIAEVQKAEVACLRTPVTSVKGFATYVQNLSISTKRPLAAVVTTVTLVPDPKFQFRLEFKFKEAVENMDVIKALLERGEKELEAAITATPEDETPSDGPASSKF